jgi:hypothetical protein
VIAIAHQRSKLGVFLKKHRIDIRSLDPTGVFLEMLWADLQTCGEIPASAVGPASFRGVDLDSAAQRKMAASALHLHRRRV